jgi:hypothetical protein
MAQDSAALFQQYALELLAWVTGARPGSILRKRGITLHERRYSDRPRCKRRNAIPTLEHEALPIMPSVNNPLASEEEKADCLEVDTKGEQLHCWSEAHEAFGIAEDAEEDAEGPEANPQTTSATHPCPICLWNPSASKDDKSKDWARCWGDSFGEHGPRDVAYEISMTSELQGLDKVRFYPLCLMRPGSGTTTTGCFNCSDTIELILQSPSVAAQEVNGHGSMSTTLSKEPQICPLCLMIFSLSKTERSKLRVNVPKHVLEYHFKRRRSLTKFTMWCVPFNSARLQQ